MVQYITHKWSVYILIGIWAMWTMPCPAQEYFQNPSVLDMSNGLPSNRVVKLVKDHKGFTWLGTDNGLCRFDGNSTRVFQPDEQDSTAICYERIHDLLADSAADKLWVATAKFLSVYDYEKDVFKNYPHVPGQSSGPPDNHPYCIAKDQDGQIWISFRQWGIYRYRPETDDFVQEFCDPGSGQEGDPTCKSVFKIITDSSNDSILWLGSTGIYRFNRFTGQFSRFAFKHADKNTEQLANGVRCIYQHSDGKIYYGTWYEGVFVLDPATGVVSRFEPACTPPGYHLRRDVVNSFYPKSKHEFWISSLKGMQLYDSEQGCVTKIWINEIKRKKWYSVEYIDEDQRIWSCSYDLGLLVYNPLLQQFRTHWYEDEDTDLMCLTRKILEDTLRKKLYVLPQSGRGLYILDQVSGKWSVVQPPIDFIDSEGNGFLGWDMTFLDNGKLFIVENARLYLYEPGTARLRPFYIQSPKLNPRMRKVEKDRQGMLWVTGYGWPVQRFDLKRKEVYTFDEELARAWGGSLGADHIEEDKNGNIWMRENNGLLIYKVAENKFVYIPHVGGGTNALRGMGHLESAPNGDVWVATNSQTLAYAHADSLESGLLRHYGKQQGLIGNKVWMVKLIGAQLWVFTDKAIQLFNTQTRQFENHFDLNYGLGAYDPSCTLLSSGALAVGKRKAVSFFFPDKLIVNRELPRPYIAHFKVFDNEWKLRTNPSRPDSLVLSHRQNFFSFEFSSIAYNLPAGVRYLYQLEGFDEDWKDGTQRKFAAYTNVPGGNYLFKIKALNSEGMAAAEPFHMHLHISTVWWKTWWFWTLASLTLLGLGWLAYRYKIGQVRKEERLKSDYERKLADVELSALRAQMNPHFIFNSLNSIEYYIINNEPDKASDYLNRFSRLIRLILQNSKNSIVPLKDDLEALRLYIEMESMRFDNLFEYEVKVEKGLDLDRCQIPPMLLQPYVENSIWHGLMQKKGGGGKIDLVLRQDNGHLVCIIEDNGIGREAAQQIKSKSGTNRKSFGMKITGDRLALLNKIAKANASIQVFDLKDGDGNATGTRVELLIPV